MIEFKNGEFLTPVDYFTGPKDYTSNERKFSESKMVGKAKQWARDHGWHVRKWAAPGNSGVPDDIFVKAKRVVFIEAKRVGNEPTGNQCLEAEDLLRQGAEVHWCDTVRGYKEALEGIYE